MVEANKDDTKGGMNQYLLFLNLSNMLTSIFCATKKARPEPMAILIEIISEKFVETDTDNITPIINPI